MKLVSLAKAGAYCSNYKNLGTFKDLKGCLNKVSSTSDAACAGGEGYFVYAPNSDGWCSCCTDAGTALTDIVET